MKKFSKTLIIAAMLIANVIFFNSLTMAMQTEGAVDGTPLVVEERGLPELFVALDGYTDEHIGGAQAENVAGANNRCSLNKMVTKIVKNTAVYAASGAIIASTFGIEHEAAGLWFGFGLSMLDAISSIFDNYRQAQQAQQV
ncbi:MAG: hypothetical protein LBL38_01185 [Lactobacillales bacterium]|jgi:hypothetical protein|nr:hypothetical protein [Lactobacillales bacterium]